MSIIYKYFDTVKWKLAKANPINLLTFERRLNPPAEEESIAMCSRAFGDYIPEDYRDLYSYADGESDNTGFFTFRFLPINEVIADIHILKQHRRPTESVGTDAIADDIPIRKRKLLPFADDSAECYLALDLSPSKNGTYRQIVAIDLENDKCYLVAESLDKFLLMLTDMLEDGRVFVDEPEKGVYILNTKGNHFIDDIEAMLYSDKEKEKK